MKKRTKKKIHNRIIKKLISGQPLSGFDKKYHESMVKKVYVDTAKSESCAESKKQYSGLQKTSDAMRSFGVISEDYDFPIYPFPDLLSIAQGRTIPNKDHNDVFDSLRYATEVTHEIAVIAAVEEPNKWQKVKSKLKGWFAK